VPPGIYRIVLVVDGKELAQTARVEPDPTLPITELFADLDNETDEADEAFMDEDEAEMEAEGEGPIID
jgi:hypothetical protein